MATTSPEKKPEEEMKPEFLRQREQLGRRDVENPDQKDNRPAGDASDPRGGLSEAEAAGDDNGHADAAGKTTKAGAPRERSFYRSKAETSDAAVETPKGRLGLRITPKRALFGGGILATAIIALMLFFASGPLEFIHLAQLMTRFHFKSQQDQSNDRFLQEARWIKYKFSGQVYRTNLGLFQNKIADRLEARLSAAGIEPAYNNGSFGVSRDGWILDPAKLSTSEFEDFSGKSKAEIQQYFKENFPDVPVTEIATGEHAGKLFLDESAINSQIFGHFTFAKLNRLFLTSTKMNAITAAEGARIMSARAGSTWHPITRARNIGTAKLVEFLKGWWSATENGTREPISDQVVKNPKEKVPNPKAATLAEETANEIAAGEQTSQTESGGDLTAQSKFADSIHLKLGAGALAASGVACILKGLDERAAEIKMKQVVFPLVREGATMIGVGNQVMSSQDLTTKQLGFYKTLLDGPSTQNGGSTADTSWVQAASIQAEMGNNPKAGIPPSKTLMTINDNSPFHFLKEGIIGAALGPVCSDLGQAFQVVIGIFTGGIEELIAQSILSFMFLNNLMDEAAHWISGSAVDPFARGADFGNSVNFGSRLAANAQAITNGGRALSGAESGQLALYESQQSQQEFQSHSLAYKLFDPYDARSVLSGIIDRQSPEPGQELNNLASSLFGFRHTLASAFKLFTPAAHATEAFNYGFPQYGFSTGEMDSSTVKNPYKNADEVVNTILPQNPGYIGRVKDCFGATIDPTTYSVTAFDLNPVDLNHPDPSKENFWAAPGTPGFNPACADSSPSWMKVRFYVFDTQTMASTTCYLGEPTDAVTQQACAMTGNDQTGGNNSPASSSPAGDSTTTLASSSNYQRPLRKVSNLRPGRVDQGVDYSGTGPVYAIGSGKVVQVEGPNVGWETEGYWISYQLLPSPVPGQDFYVYVAEDCKPNVTVGETVTSDTVLCTMFNGPSGIETGWAKPPSAGNEAMAHDVWAGKDSDSVYTAFGLNFSQLLQSLGDPPGTIKSGAQELGSLPTGWPSW